MNTKLKKWASAFIEYYFKNTTSDNVCLGINKEDLPLVYQFHETYIKLPNLKVNPLEDFMKCFMEESEITLPGNRKVKDYNPLNKISICDSTDINTQIESLMRDRVLTWFPSGSAVKNLLAMQETQVLFLD